MIRHVGKHESIWVRHQPRVLHTRCACIACIAARAFRRNSLVRDGSGWRRIAIVRAVGVLEKSVAQVFTNRLSGWKCERSGRRYPDRNRGCLVAVFDLGNGRQYMDILSDSLSD